VRLAIFIAAALGSGCIVGTTSGGEASVYWSVWASATHGEFGSSSATATEVCAQAGVDAITLVLIDPTGVPLAPVSGACITGNDVPGTRFTGLGPGTWQFEIHGYRGTELVFEDVPADALDNAFDVRDGEVTVVDTTPAAIYWDLDLGFSVPTCTASETVAFDLVDVGTGHVVFSTHAGTTNPPVALGCTATTTTLTIPSVPPATYALVHLAQVDAAGLDVHYPGCIPNWVQPGTASVTVPTVTIDGVSPPLTYCP